MADIMVIDDDWQLRSELCHALEHLGHAVDEAGDGDEALGMIRKKCPDLVITDILMPNREGIATIKVLRKLRPDIGIIAMSGGGRVKNTDFLDIARRFGANAVLEKPISIEALGRAVASCLGANREPATIGRKAAAPRGTTDPTV